MRPKFIFLDLEGTVIDDIDHQNFGNLQKVKRWLAVEGAYVVGIFSFAIDNNEEKHTFMRSPLRKTLEERLSITIGNVVTTEDAMAAAKRRTRVAFDGLWEFKQLWGKERGFIDFAWQTHKDAELVLLDDLVDNQTIFFNDQNLTIHLVNVDSLS